MFRLIKIVFNALLLVLAVIGFNTIGGDKYVEMAKTEIINFMQEYQLATMNKIGDFSKLDEEFQVDNSVNLMGYKAVIAEHKSSGQKMIILDSGKKPLLTRNDITGDGLDLKIKNLSEKFKYQGIKIKELKIVDRGTINAYGQKVPFAKFEATVTKLPVPEISGIVASATTSDNSEKLLISLSEKKKYSQLISKEFYSSVSEKK